MRANVPSFGLDTQLPGSVVHREISLAMVETLLRRLVNIESESGHERRAMEFVEGVLRAEGIETVRQRVGPHRFNLIARLSDKSGGILFNTHVDTVPRYTGQAKMSYVRRGWLFGRGACDAKGSLAAMLSAFIGVRRALGRNAVSATLSVMVGEENSGDGVERLMADRVRYKCAVVGEPTNLGIANLQAGYTEVDINIQRKRCHAFDPMDSQSVLDMAQILAAFQTGIERRYGRATVPFVRWIRGGEANEFWYRRDTCVARIIVNTPPSSHSSDVLTLLKTTVRRHLRPGATAGVTIALTDEDDGIMTARGAPIVRAMSSALRTVAVKPRLVYMPSWTDGSTLAGAGISTIVFGPGRLSDAHTDRERVKLRDVRTAALALTGVLVKGTR